MTGLDTALLEAHAAGDLPALVALYTAAADQAGTAEMAGFYLTHAHVFALELGDPAAPLLRQRLIADGREEPLPQPRAPLR